MTIDHEYIMVIAVLRDQKHFFTKPTFELEFSPY
jgi:hypothetical protein